MVRYWFALDTTIMAVDDAHVTHVTGGTRVLQIGLTLTLNTIGINH